MTTTKKNVVITTNENENKANEIIVKGNITAVTMPKNIGFRVTITLDCEPFESIDFETGEVITKQAFGINIYNLVNQVGDKVEPIGLANALAMGKPINPQIVALSLNGASIVAKRVLHHKGEQRAYYKNGENPLYERDCYITEIVNITSHIKPMFQSMLDKLITEKPFIEPQQVVLTNPFEI